MSTLGHIVESSVATIGECDLRNTGGKTHKLRRLADREWLSDFVQFAMGDPKLNSWEAQFMHSVKAMTFPDGPLPTKKQVEKIEQIAEKVGYGKADAPLSDDDDDADVFDEGD